MVRGQRLQPLKRFILDKTEGNPFFMEEIVQTLREQGILAPASGVGWVETHPTTAPLPQTLQLPTTVQGVLSARMDRLPTEEKALLQTLAVIGREFSSSLLRKVVPEREDELLRLLSRLQTAEFVYEQPAFPEVEYIFKHALTQEVAYNSLLIERRKVLHERTAQAIEGVYQHRLDDHYSELAYHYSRSGNTQKAVDYLQPAGQQIGHHAPVEAVPYLTTALEFLKSLPDTPERRRRELLLQMTLGPVLMATKGYTDPAVEGVYLRSRELCQQMGETSQLFPVLQGLFWVSAIGGKFQEARRLGEQLLTAAQLERAPTLLAEAYGLLGLAFYWLGDFLSAKDQLERGIRSYDSQQYHAQELFSLTDAGVICRAYQAWTLWHLGYPDQALRRTAEMQARAAELSHPHSLGFILAGTTWLHQFRREEQATKEQSAALSSFCVEKGFTQLSAWGTHPLGWALGEQGNGEEGITIIRQNIAALLAAKAYVGQTYGLALLAQVQNKLGQIREGLDTLAEALAVMHKTGERFYEAELYRLKGELTLQQENQKSKAESQKSKISSPQPLTPSTQGVVEEAAGYFHKAIEISRKQQAKSLELRATMSLARLGRQQDKHAEAHRMLAEIYGWFTEGFDTKDLQETKGLLAELAAKLPASREGP